MSFKETDELYYLVEKSIDDAFNEKFLFDLYVYVKLCEFKRAEIRDFIESSTAANLSSIVFDLELYIKGGDEISKQAYGHLSMPKARRAKDYLYKILTDAWKYEQERRPGRKPGTKNRRKRTAVTHK